MCFEMLSVFMPCLFVKRSQMNFGPHGHFVLKRTQSVARVHCSVIFKSAVFVRNEYVICLLGSHVLTTTTQTCTVARMAILRR